MRMIMTVVWFIAMLAGPFIYKGYVTLLPEYENGIGFMLSMAYFISAIGLFFYWGTDERFKIR